MALTVPSLDIKALVPKFLALSLGKHYFLLSVKRRFPLLDDTVPRLKWIPVRHQEQKSQFAEDDHSLDNETSDDDSEKFTRRYMPTYS